MQPPTGDCMKLAGARLIRTRLHWGHMGSASHQRLILLQGRALSLIPERCELLQNRFRVLSTGTEYGGNSRRGTIFWHRKDFDKPVDKWRCSSNVGLPRPRHEQNHGVGAHLEPERLHRQRKRPEPRLEAPGYASTCQVQTRHRFTLPASSRALSKKIHV